jgi:hypothetical protein
VIVEADTAKLLQMTRPLRVAMPKTQPVAKIIVLRIALIWLSAHVGCIVGQECYGLAFNSLDSFIRDTLIERPRELLQLLNPRMVGNTCEFALASTNAPGVGLILLTSAIVWWGCIVKRKWRLLLLATFCSFAVLDFSLRLAWKTG